MGCFSRLRVASIIAEQWAEGADLYGPGAEAWRPFNPNYFLAARGEPVTLARSLDDLEKLAKDYEKWKTWYEKFDAFLDRVLLPANRMYKPLVTDFMAAMSQMGKISRNVDQMVNKLREFLETGSVTRAGIDFPAKPKFDNLLRAMAGMPLRGPKIGPFSEAMRGVRGAAAIDRHVAMVLFGTRSPSKAQIKKGREVAAQIAERLGWDTRQVQAAWWAAGKELFGKRGNVVETYEQFLELHRDELNDLLTKDREGAGRGRAVVERVPQRAGETSGVQGAGGREALGEREGPEIRVARKGDPNYIPVGGQDEIQRSEDEKRRASAARAERSYAQGAVGRGTVPVGRAGADPNQEALGRMGAGQRLAPDPRILKTFGADWPTGFDVLGLPNPPAPDPSKYPKLDAAGHTYGLTKATVGEKLAELLGIPPGTISRSELHDAIVKLALSDPSADCSPRV